MYHLSFYLINMIFIYYPDEYIKTWLSLKLDKLVFCLYYKSNYYYLKAHPYAAEIQLFLKHNSPQQ